MIEPVLGISVNPVFQKPHATSPARRLEFLQNKDVFFSNTSYRAQLSCFLENKTSKPLMFSYMRNDQKTLWDRLAPITQRDIILLTSTIEEPTDSKNKPDEPTKIDNNNLDKNQVLLPLEGTKQQTTLSENAPDNLLSLKEPFSHVIEAPVTTIDFQELAKITSEKKNPFVSGNFASIDFVLPEDKKTSSEINTKIQILTGEMIQPNQFFQLEQAFNQANMKRETPSWVHESSGNIVLLNKENPRQAGFQQITHPWKGFIYRTLANMLAPLLRLKIEENSIRFPNGAIISLTPSSWKDTQGKTTRLYEVVGLPDGKWLRLTNNPIEQVISSKDRKQIRKIVDEAVKQFESAGKVRELVLNSDSVGFNHSLTH